MEGKLRSGTGTSLLSPASAGGAQRRHQHGRTGHRECELQSKRRCLVVLLLDKLAFTVPFPDEHRARGQSAVL